MVWRAQPLRTRLIIALAIILAPLAMLGIVRAVIDYREDRATAERNLVEQTSLLTREHQRVLGATARILSLLAADADIRGLRTDACDAALRDAVAALKEYRMAIVAGPDGAIRCRSDAARPVGPAGNWRWFQDAVTERRLIVSSIFQSPALQDRTLVAALPMLDADRAVTGVVALYFDLGALLGASSAGRMTPDTSLTLMDAQGGRLLLAGAPLDLGAEAQAALVRAAGSEEAALAMVRDSGGHDLVIAVTSLVPQRLYAAMARDVDAILKPLRAKLAMNLAVLLAIWLVAVLAIGATTHRMIVRWILHLRNATTDYIAGRPVARTTGLDDAPLELRELGTSIMEMMDVSDRRGDDLKEAIAHRDQMIKEIHHRVRNNLQIIASLLNLQTRTVTEPAARETLLALRTRINALALIHRNLYENHDLQLVDLDAFLPMLCNQLQDLSAAGRRHVAIRTLVPRLSVPADAAVTLSMLLTEVVSSTVKQLSPGDTAPAAIGVELSPAAAGRQRLTVSADGIVDPFEFPDSLSRQLIEGYVRQLGGTIEARDAGATTIVIEVAKLA